MSLLVGDAGNEGFRDGLGAAAYFNGISAMALDGAGNVYAVDQNQAALRKVTPQGWVTSLSGGTCFSRPRDVAAYADGTLFVIDQVTRRICRIGLDGQVRQIAVPTDFTPQAATFGATLPSTVTAPPSGGLLVTTQRAVYRIAPDGWPVLLAGRDTGEFLAAEDGQGAAARFSSIYGITADAAGNAYVADGGRGLRKVTPSGVVTTVAAVDLAAPPFFPDVRQGMAVDPGGNVVLAPARLGATEQELLRVAPDGTVSRVPGSSRVLGNNVQLAFDAGGALVFGGPYGVGVFALDGQVSTLAGRILTAATLAVEELPIGIDPGGNVVTLIHSRMTVRRIAPDGKRLPWAPGREELVLAPPEPRTAHHSVALDELGNVYAAYSRNGDTQGATVLPADTAIYRVTPAGDAQRIHYVQGAQADFIMPSIAFAARNALYLFDMRRGEYMKLEAGQLTSLAKPPAMGSHSLAMSPGGRLLMLASDTQGGRAALYELKPGGPVVVAPAVASAAGNIVFDAEENAYLADEGTIQKVTPQGQVSVVAGVPGVTTTQLGSLPGTMQPIQRMVRGIDGVFYLRSGKAILRVRLN